MNDECLYFFIFFIKGKKFYINARARLRCAVNAPLYLQKPVINRFFFMAEAPTELSITDKAEDLEIGKPTKVGLFFFF